MSGWRRGPRPRFAEVDTVPEPEMVMVDLPCGLTMGYEIPTGPFERSSYFRAATPAEAEAEFHRDLHRHTNQCPTCFAHVSHPDFSLEWTT